MFKFLNANKLNIIVIILWFAFLLIIVSQRFNANSVFIGVWILTTVFTIEIKNWIEAYLSKMELRMKVGVSGVDKYEEELKKAFEAGKAATKTNQTADRYLRDFRNRIYKV